MRSKVTALCTRLLVSVIALALVGVLVPEDNAVTRSANSVLLTSSTVGRGRFSISGSVRGLYPGVTKPLPLLLKNPNRFPIKVTSVRVWIKPDLRRPGCSPKLYMSATRLARARIVRARRSRRVWLRITMKRSAPNACKAARFPLKFTGRAVRP